MTRNDLLVRVKQLINKADTSAADDSGRPKNDEILQVIEECRNETYASLFDWLPSRRAATSTMTYTADSAAVALPSAAQDTVIMRVYSTGNSSIAAPQSELQPLRIEEFANVGESGTPRYFAITGTDIRLRPVPTRDTSLTIVHVPKLSVLSSGSSSPSELPAAFHHLLAYKAAVKLRRKNNDPVVGLEEELQNIERLMITAIERRVNDNHIQMIDTNHFWS